MNSLVRNAAYAAAAIATPALAAPAGDAYPRLFPYAFNDLAAARSACETLMDPDGIARASKGAVVFMTFAGRRQVVAHSGVAAFAASIKDPRDASYPVDSAVERRPGTVVSVYAKRRSRDYLGSVRCWFSSADGPLRLLSIDVDIPRR